MTHPIKGVMAELFTLKELVEGGDSSFYDYTICCAQIISVLVIMIGVYYRCPVSTTQVCVLSMLGAAFSHLIFNTHVMMEVDIRKLVTVIIVWILSPFITMFISCALYGLIKRLILTRNTRLKALLFTPFMSGLVFIIYFSFFFSTDLYTLYLSKTTKIVVTPIVLVVGFYIGIVFKRMHFLKTKFNLPKKISDMLKHSLFIW